MAQFCAVTDSRLLEGATRGEQLLRLRSRLDALVAGGVDLIHFREKDLPDRVVLAEVRRLVRAAGARARILVNDRIDLALAAGAAGVQVTTASAGVAAIRRVAPRLLLAASVHSAAAARRAEDEGADLLVLGPIFETPSKIGMGPPLGVETLRAVASTARVPVLAIGGIALAQLPVVSSAGAVGFCAIRFFLEGPEEALPELIAAARAAFDSPSPHI